MSDHKQKVLDLQQQLLNAVKDSVSSQAYDTWFSDLNIVEIIADRKIVFSTTTLVKSEWLEIRYTDMVKSLLQQITHIEYDLSFVVRKSGAKDSENASGIKLSGYQWLFECKNTEYDEEYKDYIGHGGSDEILQLLRELKVEQDKTIVKAHAIANPTQLVDESFKQTITVEERITKLEEKIVKLQGKQDEQDKLVDHLCVLITTLQGKVVRINSTVNVNECSKHE